MRIEISCSETGPKVKPDGSWIIMTAPSAMTISSPAIAITDAADAATPSTMIVLRPRWAQSAAWMAEPSVAMPPPLLSRIVTSWSRPILASAKMTSAASKLSLQ